jgi:hypothetical protein
MNDEAATKGILVTTSWFGAIQAKRYRNVVGVEDAADQRVLIDRNRVGSLVSGRLGDP